MATRSLSCPNCGAALQAEPGDTTRCAYCGSNVHIDTTGTNSSATNATDVGESGHTRYLANHQVTA